MRLKFMTFAVRRRIQWVFRALKLGRSGVHTGIIIGIAESEHLDLEPD